MSDPNPPIDFVLERSLYVSNAIGMAFYGMQLLLFFFCVQLAMKNKARANHARFYTGFGLVLAILAGIGTMTNIVWAEEAWIEHRYFPGGPTAYLNATTAIWYQVWGTAAAIAVAMMNDTLLLYRCYVIWDSSWKIIAFPVIVNLASIALGIITIVTSAQPAGLFGGQSLNFGTPYFSLTVGFNLLMTLLICARLFKARRNMVSAGLEDDGLYTNMIAVMTESASLTGISGIAFVVSFAVQSETSTAFGSLWGISLSLSPQIIIYRVLQGKAWSREVAERVSTLHFASTRRKRDAEVNLQLPGSFSGSSVPSSSATKFYGLDSLGTKKSTEAIAL